MAPRICYVLIELARSNSGTDWFEIFLSSKYSSTSSGASPKWRWAIYDFIDDHRADLGTEIRAPRVFARRATKCSRSLPVLVTCRPKVTPLSCGPNLNLWAWPARLVPSPDTAGEANTNQVEGFVGDVLQFEKLEVTAVIRTDARRRAIDRLDDGQWRRGSNKRGNFRN